VLHSADKTDLEKILTTYQLSVPDYQRPYRWSKSEAEEFWEDLYGYYEDHKVDPSTESNLYLGSFIFLEKKSSDFEIVDGQQRLTSLFILLIAIKNRLREFGDAEQSVKQASAIMDILRYLDRKKGSVTGSRLRPSESISQVFNKIIDDNWNGTFDFKNLKLQSRRIQPIYDLFASKLKDFGQDDFEPLLSALYSTAIVQIVIKEREDAFSIFERTNARGMDLEASDLLKNYLFSKLRGDDVEAKWDEIHGNSDGTILRMLKYFYISENGHVTQSHLYKKIIQKAKSYPGGADELLNKMLDFSKFYSVIRTGNQEDLRNYLSGIGLEGLALDPDRAFRVFSSIEGLRFMKITQIYPLIYSILKAYVRCGLGSDEKFRKTLPIFFRNMENYHFINNLILDSVGNEVEKPYAKFAQKFSMVDKETFNTVLKDFYEFTKSKIAGLDEFKAGFKQLSYSSSSDQYQTLLYVFDRFYNYSESKDRKVTAAGYRRIFSPDKKFKDMNITIEHWLPQKKADTLSSPEAVHNIGNLLLISSTLNSILGHASPTEKVEKINGSTSNLNEVRNFPIVHEFIESYKLHHGSWTADVISDRADKLAEEAYRKIWKFEPPI
jgi:hypothetical protein